jgi:hypothetical protein
MRTLFIAAVGSLLLVASGNADLTCASSKNLGSLVECIRAHMPRRESNGYVAPTSSQRADWRIVVNQMLQGSCDFAVAGRHHPRDDTYTQRLADASARCVTGGSSGALNRSF